MFLNRLGLRRSPLVASTRRAFGGAHEIVKADAQHKFVAACNKKTVVFDGLMPTAPLLHTIANPYRHQNDLPLYK